MLYHLCMLQITADCCTVQCVQTCQRCLMIYLTIMSRYEIEKLQYSKTSIRIKDLYWWAANQTHRHSTKHIIHEIRQFLIICQFPLFFNLDLPIFSWLRVINLMMSIVELMRKNLSCLTLPAGLSVFASVCPCVCGCLSHLVIFSSS